MIPGVVARWVSRPDMQQGLSLVDALEESERDMGYGDDDTLTMARWQSASFLSDFLSELTPESTPLEQDDPLIRYAGHTPVHSPHPSRSSSPNARPSLKRARPLSSPPPRGKLREYRCDRMSEEKLTLVVSFSLRRPRPIFGGNSLLLVSRYPASTYLRISMAMLDAAGLTRLPGEFHGCFGHTPSQSGSRVVFDSGQHSSHHTMAAGYR